MTWEQIGLIFLSKGGSYVSLKLTESAGTLHLLIPAFPKKNSGRYEVGLFGGTKSKPQFVAIKQVLIAPFDRYISIEYPPALPGPLLGLRLLGQGGGTHIVQPQINVSSLTEDIMAFVTPKKNIVETFAGIPGPEFEGNQFVLESTGETFSAVNGQWLGEYKTDSITVDPVLKGTGVGVATVESSDAIGAYYFEFPESQHLESVHLTSVSGDQQVTALVLGENVRFIAGQAAAMEGTSLKMEAYDMTDPDNIVPFNGGASRPLQIHASSQNGEELQFVVKYRSILGAVGGQAEAPAE